MTFWEDMQDEKINVLTSASDEEIALVSRWAEHHLIQRYLDYHIRGDDADHENAAEWREEARLHLREFATLSPGLIELTLETATAVKLAEGGFSRG